MSLLGGGVRACAHVTLQLPKATLKYVVLTKLKLT